MTTITTNDLTKIIEGLMKAAKMVSSTMGAKGKSVIIANNNYHNNLKFTKDGVSVAEKIQFPDPLENIGAQVLISAANKTVEKCGDGTTLTSVLLSEMIKETFTQIKDKDINTVLKDLEVAVDIVKSKITEQSVKVTTPKEIQNIATVSSNSDQLGKMFYEIYNETGLDAMINLEKSETSNKTYFEINKGIQFESGFVHTSFMTNKDTEQAIYENAWVHVEDGKLNRMTPLVQEMIEQAAVQRNIPVIVIAEQFSESVIRQLSMAKVNQGVPVCLIKTPGYGNGIRKNIEDIRAFLTPEKDNIVGGYVDKIVIDGFKFIIYNDDTPNLQKRIDQVKSLHENAVEWIDRDDYLVRMHKLQNTSVVIFAGGVTPEAQSEEYDRIEDAIGAVKSAIEEGYVPGAGVTLLNIGNSIKNTNTGTDILIKTLSKPFTAILSNANEEVDKVLRELPKNALYNVKTGLYEKFKDTEVFDPAKVLKTALENALANTKLLINTSYTIYNEFKSSIN